MENKKTNCVNNLCNMFFGLDKLNYRAIFCHYIFLIKNFIILLIPSTFNNEKSLVISVNVDFN